MSKAVQELISYWQTIFSSEDPIKELNLHESADIMDKFITSIPPEPYYGYFHEDTSNDVVLLLLNPGGKNEQTEQDGWNDFITNRYIKLWSKDTYESEEKILSEQGISFRKKKKEQAERIVGEFGFLHTIEFFPFHSRSDELSSKFKNEWVKNSHALDIAFKAIKELSENFKVKHILATSSDWTTVLEEKNVTLAKHVELKKHTGSRNSFVFKKYQISEDSIPILLCKPSGNSNMDLPRDSFAVEIAQILLELSDKAIPKEHPIYQINVLK